MQGNIIPAGKTARKIEETFLTVKTLPSWLTLTGTGTPTSNIVGIESDYGYLELKTSAAVGDSAQFNLFPNGVKMDNIKELIIDLDSLCFSSAGDKARFYLNITTSENSNGASLSSERTVTKLTARNNYVQTAKEVMQYPILQLDEHKRRRNISMRVRNDRTVTLLEGDNVIAEHQFSASEMAISGSIIKPRIVLVNDTAAQNWIRFSRIAVTVVHN